MEEAERGRLRQALLRRRAELAAGLSDASEQELASSPSEATGELSQYDNHPADVSTDTWQRGQALGARLDQQALLAEVDDALARLESGHYGGCARCGQPIDPARLRAVPETRYCKRCREALEAEAAREPQARPVEEGVLGPPFGRSFHDDTGDVGFDGEDAWQAVARYGSSNTPSDVPEAHHYPQIVIDPDEDRGGGSPAEGVAGIDGRPPHGDGPPRA